MLEIGTADAGFYPAECDELGQFQWTRGSFVLEPAWPARYARLRLGYLAANGQLTLRTAEALIDDVPLRHGWHDYVVRLAGSESGPIRLTVSPTAHAAGDPRELGVMVRDIALCDDPPLLFGGDGTDRDGCYASERDGDGAFCWTRATFLVRRTHPASYAQLRLCYLGHAGRLTLSFGGKVLDDVALGYGWRDYPCYLGPAATTPIVAAVSPQVTVADDSRELGVMLRHGTLFVDQPLLVPEDTAIPDGYFDVERDDEGPFRWTRETFVLRPGRPARYAQLRLGYLGRAGKLTLRSRGQRVDTLALRHGWHDYVVSLEKCGGQAVAATVSPLVPINGDDRQLGVMLRRAVLFDETELPGLEPASEGPMTLPMPQSACNQSAGRWRRLLRSPQRAWQFGGAPFGRACSQISGRIRGSHAWQTAVTKIGRKLGRTTAGNFIVLSSPRSGTTALVDYLNCHPRVRCRGEILNAEYLYYGEPHKMDAERLKLHVESFFMKPPTILLGAKFLTYQFDEMPITLADLLATLEQPRVILLYRQQILEQFASLKLAERTGVWHSNKPVHYDPTWLDPDEFAAFAQRERRMWRDNLAALDGSDVQFVTCEQLHRRPLETMRSVFQFLGLQSCPVETFVAKLRDKPLTEKISNYRDFMRPRGNLDLRLDLPAATATAHRLRAA